MAFEVEDLEEVDSVEAVFEAVLRAFEWEVLDQVESLLEELGQVE